MQVVAVVAGRVGATLRDCVVLELASADFRWPRPAPSRCRRAREDGTAALAGGARSYASQVVRRPCVSQINNTIAPGQKPRRPALTPRGVAPRDAPRSRGAHAWRRVAACGHWAQWPLPEGDLTLPRQKRVRDPRHLGGEAFSPRAGRAACHHRSPRHRRAHAQAWRAREEGARPALFQVVGFEDGGRAQDVAQTGRRQPRGPLAGPSPKGTCPEGPPHHHQQELRPQRARS